MTPIPPRPPHDVDAHAALLDEALGSILEAPSLPANFRARLLDVIEELAPLESPAETRARIEREQRLMLAELEGGYVRLRRRTLGTLLVAAFTAGAAGAAAGEFLPRVASALHLSSNLVLAAAGAAIALLISLRSSATGADPSRFW